MKSDMILDMYTIFFSTHQLFYSTHIQLTKCDGPKHR